MRIRACTLTSRPMEPDVAEIVGLVNLCTHLHALPKPGGILDQDALTMFLFAIVLSAQQERAELDAKRRT
jgi:hypothetical protein